MNLGLDINTWQKVEIGWSGDVAVLTMTDRQEVVSISLSAYELKMVVALLTIASHQVGV